MMLEELQRRNYSKGTIRSYLRAVERVRAVLSASRPISLGRTSIRSYQAYLLRTGSWPWALSSTHVAALAFLLRARH